MVTHLFDTNALAEPARAEPNAAFMRRMRRHASEIAISSVTWAEAVFGLERLPAGRRRDELRTYLYDVVARSIPILPYDAAAAEVHGRERARLEAAGTPAPFADAQIAATAVVNGAVLVTANVQDFDRFSGLRVENWLR